MTVDSQGQVYLGGDAVINGNATTTEMVVTRFNATGGVDVGNFGTNGQAIIRPTDLVGIGVSDAVTALALQPDGRLIVGGSTTYFNSATTLRTQLTALRLRSNGTIDGSFGYDGNIVGGITPAGSVVGGIAVQPDGKVVFADRNSPTFVRLDAIGFPDPTFGTNGTAIVKLPSDGSPPEGSIGVSLRQDGSILAFQGASSHSSSNGGFIDLLGQGAENDFADTGATTPAVLFTQTANFFAQFPEDPTLGHVNRLFGTAGYGNTLPAPGAYDGSGIDELAVYLPKIGAFAVRPYTGGPDVITYFGTPGTDASGLANSLPAPGDYDGSGKTELAVYEPALGGFIYRPANGGPDTFVKIGIPGAGNSIPAPADYVGTGQTDFAVYLVQQGAFAYLNPSSHQIETFSFGLPGAGQAIPAPGYYSGYDYAQFAVYLPALGELDYQGIGSMPEIEKIGVPGVFGSLPAPGDYDHSGKTEAAVLNLLSGDLVYLPANGGAGVTISLGEPGSQSVPFTVSSEVYFGQLQIIVPGSLTSASPASDDIPLTPDVLDVLAGTAAKKKAATA